MASHLNDNDIDLMFLDIQMPEMDGFEVLNHIDRNKLPVIIFVTAYDTYAPKAFEVHAIDYLLKPFDDERFNSALMHSEEILKNKSKKMFTDKLIGLIEETDKIKNPQYKFLERIVIKSSGRIYFVRTKDVIRIKASGKYLEIKDSQKDHKIRKTLTQLEEQLDPDRFIRIHRSVILNVDHITEMQHWYKNEYIFILSNGEKFTSGSSYRKNLEQILNPL